MQYSLGVIHWWRHQKIPDWVKDEDAKRALQETSQYFENIFQKETLPQKPEGQGVDAGSLFGEKSKMQYAQKHAQLVHDLILPQYEKLIEKSQKEVEQMLQDGKIKPPTQQSGQGQSQAGKEPGEGQPQSGGQSKPRDQSGKEETQEPPQSGGQPQAGGIPPELLPQLAKDIIEGNAK